MPDRSSHWAELITPQTTEAFYIGYGGGADRPSQSLIDSVFSVRNSDRAFEEHIGAGVFGSDGWNFDGPNGAGRVNYDQRNKGYLTRSRTVSSLAGSSSSASCLTTTCSTSSATTRPPSVTPRSASARRAPLRCSTTRLRARPTRTATAPSAPTASCSARPATRTARTTPPRRATPAPRPVARMRSVRRAS
jgi:hypothetical protein